MSPVSMIGALLITLALIAFGIASISLLQFKKVTKCILCFLLTGIVFDILAIVCMLAGAEKISFTFHNVLGILALLAMFTNWIMVVKVYSKKGEKAPISKRFYLYSLFAFTFWVVSYITDLILVILN